MADLKLLESGKIERKNRKDYLNEDIKEILDFQDELLCFQEKLPSYYKIKVLSETMVAGFLLLALMPVFAFISIYLFFKYGSPVYFKQKRVGLNARPFYLYKFRTMSNNAPTVTQMGFNPIDKIKDDPRVLGSFGNFLRKYKLDELPQLLNVVKGEMLLIGPRPYPYTENYIIKRSLFARYAVKPGISGPWQIQGNLDLTASEKLLLDNQYVKELSFKKDMKIFFITIYVVLFSGEKSSSTSSVEEPEKIRKI